MSHAGGGAVETELGTAALTRLQMYVAAKTGRERMQTLPLTAAAYTTRPPLSKRSDDCQGAARRTTVRCVRWLISSAATSKGMTIA
jgi:hypothetical protein